MRPDNLDIPRSFEIAAEQGLEFHIYPVQLRDAHPNTALLEVWDAAGKKLELQAASLGGGRILVQRLDGIFVSFTGDYHTLLIRNQDTFGAVAAVTGQLSRMRINVANMSLCRQSCGSEALMVIETDHRLRPMQVDTLRRLAPVLSVTYYEKEEESDA